MSRSRAKHRNTAGHFAAWLQANGARVLTPCAYEFARFRAHGQLCIVSEGRKGRNPHPGLATEAYTAWVDGRPLDLATEGDDGPVEDWRVIGRGGAELAERAKAGEVLDVATEAEKLGIAVDRLVRILTAHGVATTTARGSDV